MAETKAQWRARLLRARGSIEAEARRAASAAVVARVAALTAFARAHSVLLYVAVGGEIDPHALALHAWQGGKQVYHPCDGAPAWRLLAAAPDAQVPLTAPPAPILVVAPGVGFDVSGERLGRGGGYYDRAIEVLRRQRETVVVGAAYDLQIADALPYDAWDQPVDLVVTERRTIAPPMPRHARGRRDAPEVRDEL